jgi:hypothetical protein
MSLWDPHIDLMQLLGALGEEIAAATEGEVVQAGLEARQSLTETAREVRELIRAASGDPAEPFDPDIGPGEGRIDLEGSRPRGIIAERGSRPYCRH